MTDLGFVGLVSAYVLVAVLLLSVNLQSSWSWLVKAAVTVLTALFYVVTYLSLPQLLGWPIDGNLPEKFRLEAVLVQQPDKLTDSKGAIYAATGDAHGGFDGRPLAGPADLRRALLEHGELFVQTFAEKLLTYAVGRPLAASDMPAVREIVRHAARDDYRMSALVLGVARSVPMQMRQKPLDGETE